MHDADFALRDYDRAYEELALRKAEVERLEAELALSKGAIKAANRMMDALVKSRPLAELSATRPRDAQSIREIFFRWAMAQPLDGDLGKIPLDDLSGCEAARQAAEAMIAELVASSSHPEMHASTQDSTGCIAEAGTGPARAPGLPMDETARMSG